MDRPLQNRVLPTGEIVADPARGTFMGNRGVLHDAEGRLGGPRWRHQRWICCLLAFKGRRRRLMSPGRYTELFFLDEAVALAAGHRPCAECRRAAYLRWRAAWADAFGQAPAAIEIDRELHGDRLDRARRQRRFRARIGDLPEGAFVLVGPTPHLVRGLRAVPFSPAGYGPAISVASAMPVTVLTPRRTVEVLRAGYVPVVHETAPGGRATSVSDE